MRQSDFFPQILAANARRHGDRIALRSRLASGARREISYRALEDRSRYLAQGLLNLPEFGDSGWGDATEPRVALAFQRSPEMVIAMLAVLRAGGAFLPLDLEAPAARLAWLIEDAAPVLVLSDRSTLPPIEPPVLTLDELRPEAFTSSRAPNLHGDQLAYMIYTSGSTGRPKGTLLTHRNLAEFSAANPTQVRDSDVVLQAASPSFDATIFEIFVTLRAGACLDFGQVGHLAAGEDLLRLLDQQRISHAMLTPSVLKTLPEGRSLSALNTLIAAGEACPVDIPRRWQSDRRRVLNAYGPTETTVLTTVADCQEEKGAPSIGRTFGKVEVCIVTDGAEDEDTAGELLIGGPGVARGYHRRPALTAERFVPDPESASAFGARMYRSGDLVRPLGDGRFDFLGRLDHQIKIRGCRIEPGEVEAVLRELPPIVDASVMPQDDRLVAFLLIDRPDIAIDLAQVRHTLAARLPAYMVPSVFRTLPTWPLTISGKLDRQALFAALDEEQHPTTESQPRTRLEQTLAEIWREILDVSSPGLDDDFFLLGGHSLNGIQLVTRTRERLGIELSMHTLFEYPTLAELARVLEPQLAAHAEATDLTGPVSKAPRRLPRDRPLPLSTPQRRLWYLDQLGHGEDDAGDASYNMMVCVRFDGALDLDALKRGLAVILERHEVLRTRLVLLDGEPRQIIEERVEVPLECIDLTPQYQTQRYQTPQHQTPQYQTPQHQQGRSWESESRHQAEAFLRRPFALDRDPMLRVLALLGPDRHHILLVMHHVASDGWSIGVLLRELGQLYTLFKQDPSAVSSLPPLALQYADLAHWQDERLDENRTEALLRFWQGRLADAPTSFELPTDRPRSSAGKKATQGYEGGTHNFQLNEGLLDRLEALGQQAGTTLFMTLLSAWHTLLYRHSWQRDLVHSVPVANRSHPLSEPLIGFFTNMLLIRLRLRPNLAGRQGFLELLSDVRQASLDAFAHQDLPFDTLVEALQPDRQTGGVPLIQSGFALQNAFDTGKTLRGLSLEELDIHTGTSRFDLSLSLSVENGELLAGIEYRADLFDRTTLARLGKNFDTLLTSLLKAPTTALDDLSILPLATHQQLVHELGRQDQPFDVERTVHDLVIEQVRRTPEALAAQFGNHSLSYRQLEKQSASEAERLREEAKVQVGDGVGVLLERGLDLPIALLAVLRAGGVAIPLDPDLPRERLNFMLDDTRATTLLTDTTLLEGITLLKTSAPITHIDSPSGHVGAWSGTVLLARSTSESRVEPDAKKSKLPEISAGHLAYIVYTSGSTGRPKGVMMHHRGLRNRLLWQQHAFPIGPGDRALQNLSIGFDAAIWQFFGPWSAGVTVVLPPPGLHMDTVGLARFISEEEITCADFVPSILAPLLDELQTLPRCAVNQIVSGGEALHPELARRVLDRLPDARLINIYGPTETSLTITATLCTATRLQRQGLLPIGRPIANLRALVLDHRCRPVPLGTPGEICAVGIGVTAGYLRRPALTALRFPPDPSADLPGARLYRSGDLGRQLANGDFEFLGRVDHQVKIRGVRIELGEIEAQLQQLPDVRDAVVLARDDVPGARPGEKRLVAYVVATVKDSQSAPLRRALKTKLIPAMVPGLFLFLDALPLTVNGKVDRKALPAPSEATAQDERPIKPPRDRLELELVQIWCQVLNLETVSTSEPFFDLGGHSLLAVKLVSEMRQQLGVEIDLAEIYTAGTIEDMAARLRERTRQRLPGTLVRLRSVRDEKHALFCVHTVDGGASAYASLASSLDMEGSVFGFQAPGLEDRVLEHRVLEDRQDTISFESLAREHVEALLAWCPEGAFALCGWSSGGLLASEMARQLEARHRRPDRLILLDTHPQHQQLALSSEDQQRYFAHSLLGQNAFTIAPGVDDEAFLDHLLDLATKLSEGIDHDFLQRRWLVFTRLIEATACYQRHAGERLPHDCPILLIRATRSPAAWREPQLAACRALTTASFEVEEVEADHHTLLKSEAVPRIIGQVFRQPDRTVRIS